ncbi:MAG: hypothetical protein JWO54_449 [Candidatus Saccharibacteria bacterium]|nr:hypothetical protein [Candidatus Saccharibacteria bacterium]MDB5180689.1 hypothetical protein [Candidatus Saccharibacteria bacterium]
MNWALMITAAVVVVSGLALKFGVPWFRKDTEWNITWREFIAGALVAGVIVIPGVFALGKAWSTAEALNYEEFYNGVETSATVVPVECHPGYAGGDESSGHSNCYHEYTTGETYSYTVIYFVTVSDGCDSKGNCSSHQETRTRSETADIYNPYAVKEYTYAITDSLGGAYDFPEYYVKEGEGYGNQAIPAEIPRGDPAEWLSAKQRLDEGNPRPVTKMFHYDNYILASQDELLKPFSKNVKRYLSEKVLPEHTAGINQQPMHGYNNTYADKVSFVGVKVADEAAWQDSLMSFNAALGSQLRGDMHLVLIDASLVNSPTDYMNALKAYWLGEDFGRRAIAKNAIIVVAGVRGNTVDWGLASTGMPYGNEVMLQGIANFLPDTALEPAQLIGSPRTQYLPDSNDDGDAELKVTVSKEPGVLERVVLKDFPFKRACMECTDDEGQIGYADLVNKIEPQPWQFAIMIAIVGVLSLVWWYFAGWLEFFNWSRKSSYDGRDTKSTEYDPYDPYSVYSKKRRRTSRQAYRRY